MDRLDNPRCKGCTFPCGSCRWRARQTSVGQAGTTVVLDMADPATVSALFEPGPLADEMDRADERHDAMRDDPELYAREA